MKFTYDDIRTGSAICRLELNGQEFTFHPSFFSDALGDFVTYLASAHPLSKLGWKEGAFGYFKGGITWNMDSVLLCWEFQRDFEDLKITITELQNSMVSPKTPILCGENRIFLER
ncbi:hypothetical protein [Bacillus massiliigorillae]|uniref:hypothetical protein n=1 Tax=Bacillus massiliigorillae TaxID=1243664 RepID=UPI00039E6AEC|nr:hypothetical protein [Bacillus massiliigorillae]